CTHTPGPPDSATHISQPQSLAPLHSRPHTVPAVKHAPTEQSALVAQLSQAESKHPIATGVVDAQPVSPQLAQNCWQSFVSVSALALHASCVQPATGSGGTTLPPGPVQPVHRQRSQAC